MITWEEMNDNITKNFVEQEDDGVGIRYTLNKGFLYVLSHIIQIIEAKRSSFVLTIYNLPNTNAVQIGIL